MLLLSDTHGVLDDRIAAFARECDIAVHAGDVGSARIIDVLKTSGAQVFAVRGNNDTPAKWSADERATLANLRDVERVELPGGVLVATHGDAFTPAKRHTRLRAAYPDARAIVYGHSHHLVIDDTEAPWVLNPGAAGRARTHGGPSCLLLHASARAWRVEALRFERISVR
ncbi:MAG: metallophosphoesterase family protein [Rhodanobacteraceae bacterium]